MVLACPKYLFLLTVYCQSAPLSEPALRPLEPNPQPEAAHRRVSAARGRFISHFSYYNRANQVWLFRTFDVVVFSSRMTPVEFHR